MQSEEKKIRLRKPLLIDGKERWELTYDADEITGDAYIAAENAAAQVTNESNFKAGIFELDYTLHTYLGYAAIIAVNPDIGILDLKRIKGYDNVQITRIGRNFITEGSEDESKEKTDPDESPSEVTPSDDSPEPTPSDTTSLSADCSQDAL
jgi:hypothetical protein